jgi:hypothetical protein
MFSSSERAKTRRLWPLLAAVLVIAAVVAGIRLSTDRVPAGRATVGVGPANGLGELSFSTSLAADAASSAHCGRATAATMASVNATVAHRIYVAELKSYPVRVDLAHVTGSQALLGALASDNESAVRAAVHAIVYTPHWHIVRLRVLRAGRVLADVGGPYVIAPVSGELTWRGRTVGTFVMSVQDDVGYVKLVTRFVGVPVDLYRNRSFLMGTLQPAPSTVSAGATVSRAGRAYETETFTARAFPTGSLRIAVFTAVPAKKVAAASCAAAMLVAWRGVAGHIAGLFKPLTAHYRDLVIVLGGAVAGFVYVRTGSTQLAGGPWPARLPDRGTVSYQARSYSVFSWEPAPPARVYVLVPAA